MRYGHILAAVSDELWAIREPKLRAILDFLAAQAKGVKYSDEEVQAKISGATAAATARREGAIAVLPLRGILANRMAMVENVSAPSGMATEALGRAFQAAIREEGVKAIVLDVDSPGGAVPGTDELSSMIFEARGRKPIVAQVNATAASAAYWIASAADEIVVTPSGAVGSIGVYAVHDNIAGMLEQEGIKRTLISAGPLKIDGNPFEALGDETRARIQARVDASYASFVRAVARNRGVAEKAVRDGFGQGDMVDAADAVSAGMADRVGTMEDTLNRFGASLYGAPPSRAPAPAPRRATRARDLALR